MPATPPRFSPDIAFCWAVGIEDTFIPQARPGLRALDEYELTQHYARWEEDLALVAQTGAQAVRWGIPWHRVQPAPGLWDWEWSDRVLDRLANTHGIIPIVDLMHYGTPLWMDNSFLNVDYPQRVAEYMGRAAERYGGRNGGLTRYFTPHNEPMVNAEFAGLRGEWPPYLVGDDGYVKLLMQIARGIVHGTRAIRRACPDAVVVQVEALWRTTSADPALQQAAALEHAKQYLALDLVLGRVDHTHPLAGYLERWGVSEADLAWFDANPVRFDILGANFYPWSWTELAQGEGGPESGPERGIERRVGAPSGHALGDVLAEAHARYGLPLMVTETSAKADVAGRAAWMDETVAAVRAQAAAGVPVVGYTWFPVMSMIDWEYRTGTEPLERYLLHLGLYDSAFDAGGALVRRATPLVARFAEYAAA